MLKITVSGNYRSTDRKTVIDFDKVTGIIPNIPVNCEEEEREGWILSHVQNRFIGSWINADKRYDKRFNSIRVCYIDKVEEVDGDPKHTGKNIKEMSNEELQDLAVSCHLIMIPAIGKGTSLRAARETAYIEYCKNILGRKIDIRAEGYKFSLLPDLLVYNDVRVSGKKEKSQEEIIRHEIEGEKPSEVDETLPAALSMDELKQIAKQKNVKFKENISYKVLYERLFC